MPVASESAGDAAPDAAYRLPRTAAPVTYRLTLEPDLDAATFTGHMEVDLVVHEPTRTLVCNAAELDVTDALVRAADGLEQPAQVTLDEAAERVTFTVPVELPPGPCTLACRFAGALNDKLRGFYRSTFTDDTGASRAIATTQMEATDARRAFPCWDEPDRKAVFEVTLVVDGDLAAYSNSPVVGESAVEGTGRRRVVFGPTMKMSTYLVAFVVGPLEATEPVDVDGVPVRIVHAPGKAHLTAFSLEVAAHALRYFSAYFDLPYPGDKLDLLAIPDFAFGAMENLGAVTFRETALLVDGERAARFELERIADVVAHEIAHMWFGDLVTMGWWEGIWLNEAFATFMETVCVDAFRPGWERWISFGDEREMALAVDGLHSTRAIEFPVGSPDEADAMFDVLTYQKGGSVLRMLEQYLGPDVFRDGVRRYLRAHAYANTVTADLWDALEEASGEPVRAMMDTWILQGGHPVLSVDGGKLFQRPFAYEPAAVGGESAIGGPWQVPVLLRTLPGAAPGAGRSEDPGGDRQRLLLVDEQPVEVHGGDGEPAGGGATVVNAGGWGVFRVAYADRDLAVLADRLAELDGLETANLFADSWASVLAGHMRLDDVLRLGDRLGDEREPGPYRTVAAALELCRRVADPPDRAAVAGATRYLFGRRAAALGWEPAPDDGERTPINPDLESSVLGVVAEQLRPGDYDAVLEQYRHPSTPQQEIRYLQALAGFPDEALALRTFELALREVRTQDGPYLVAGLLANRVGGPAVWRALAARWDEVLRRFPLNSHSRMLASVRSLCADPALAAEVSGWLSAHPVPSGQRQVVQTLERLRINVAFGARERPHLGPVMHQLTAGR